MIQNVIFDMDGTLVDTREAMLKGYAYTLDKMGLTDDNPLGLFQHMGNRSAVIFREKHHLTGEALERAMHLYYGYFEEQGILCATPYPGMEKLLEDLIQDGANLAVATARMRNGIEALFQKLDFFRYFCCIEASEPYQEYADKPAYVKRCMQQMGADRENTVMLGDKPFDVEAAHQNGIPCVGVTYGFGTREELQEAGADRIADSVEAVRQAIYEGVTMK